MTLTLVSLFDGIGGFPLAFERAGARTVATVEIDQAAAKVSQRHFPHAHPFHDVTEVTGNDLRAVGFVPDRGVITAGWPCQDLSIAGRRAGLEGARSGLWWEVVRLLDETHARWFVGENVPGLLSSRDGDDFAAVLDSLNDLGYVVDPDILDAQYFGVPQRRRRVFLVCQRVEHLVSQKTITSALITAQALLEISLITLAGLSPVSVNAGSPWDSADRCADGLRKRMQLFGLLHETASNYDTLLQALTAESVKQVLAQSTLDSLPGGSTAGELGLTAAMSSLDLTPGATAIYLSTASSWKSTLDDLLSMARSFITSTPTSATTGSKICTCARTLLNISEYIAALTPLSRDCWKPASSALTATKVLTNYARSTDGDLFSELDGVYDLVDLVAPAERTQQSLGHLGVPWPAPAEVLFECESSAGDSAAGSETGQGVTAGAAAGAGIASRSGGGLVPTVSSKWSKGSGGPAGDECQNLVLDDTHTHTHGLDVAGRRETRIPDRRRISSRGTPHRGRWPR